MENQEYVALQAQVQMPNASLKNKRKALTPVKMTTKKMKAAGQSMKMWSMKKARESQLVYEKEEIEDESQEDKQLNLTWR